MASLTRNVLFACVLSVILTLIAKAEQTKMALPQESDVKNACISLSGGHFGAPAILNSPIDSNNCAKIFKLLDATERLPIPNDFSSWNESAVLLIELADGTLARISIFEQTMSWPKSYCIGIGANVYRIRDKTANGLMHDIVKLAGLNTTQKITAETIFR
jgi:hypothetical protein